VFFRYLHPSVFSFFAKKNSARIKKMIFLKNALNLKLRRAAKAFTLIDAFWDGVFQTVISVPLVVRGRSPRGTWKKFRNIFPITNIQKRQLH
jgi:hypothetical protein